MRIKLLSLLILLFAISTFAQSPSKVLKQAEKAFGNGKAARSAGSWTKTGTIKRLRDGATGKVRIDSAAPGLYHFYYDIDGFETETAYNGRSGWIRDSRSGLSTLTGDVSRDFQAEAIYRNDLWFNYKKAKARIASSGTADVTGKKANVLTLTTAKGVAIKMYLDAATGLLVRDDVPAGDTVRTFEYSDHRAVNGMMQPHTIAYRSGDDAYEIKLDDIKPASAISKTTFDFPTLSGEPLPDIPKLLEELQANEDRVEKILDTYSFTQKYTKRELQKDGTLKIAGTEAYQMSFYKGNRIRRKIEVNDVPLNQKQQADEDEEVAKRVEEIEKRIAKQEQKGGPPEEEGRRVSIAEVLRASRLVNPRRERFQGRDVIVFDFEPNPDFDYKKAKSMLKFFGKTMGVMWIDEKDKQVARLEASLADSFNIGGGVLAKLRKGASFTLQQERVNDEVWLPSQTDINLSVRVLLVKGVELNQLIRAYNYRKFETEVKDAAVDPQKP